MRSLAFLLIAAAFAGCVGSDDLPIEGEVDLGPVFEIPDTLTGFGETVSIELERGGQGIWVEDDILYSTNGGDLEIVDVTDPQNPVFLSNLTDVGARDVDLLEWEGKLYAMLAGSGKGLHVVDVTDPLMPELVTTVVMPSAGVHNLASVPGTPYVYSSGASGDRKIDVLDITDPMNPAIHTFAIPASFDGVPVNSNGCHDISVRPDLGRAYCAGGGSRYMSGGGETFIWDITEEAGGVTNPTWVAMIDDPRLIYHHQAFVNDAGTILVINDEYIAQNCYHAELPGDIPIVEDNAQIPFAAAWIYDVSDESNPVQMSFVQNPSGWNGEDLPEQGGNCGSHFGDLIPGHDAFVMGWYQGGTMMVDFSNPADPVILDIAPALGSTWDAQVYNGHVFHSSSDLLVTQLI